MSRGGGVSNTRGSRFFRLEAENALRTGGGGVQQPNVVNPFIEGVEQFETSSRRGSVGREAQRLEGGRQVVGGGQANPSGVDVVTMGVEGLGRQAMEVDAASMQNEYDVGRKMMEVSGRLKEGVERIMVRLGDQAIGVDELKVLMKEGLKAMVESVENVMNMVREGAQHESRERVMERGKVEKLEGKIREVETRLEADRSARDRGARKESVWQMKEKIKMSNRQLKYVDIDFGRQTSDRREIVEKTIGYMREDVNISDRKRLDVIIRRTKFVVLGKSTVERTLEGQRIHNVPVLLEFRTEGDKVEVEDIMRSVQWFPVYHWPVECVEFVKGARASIREEGYSEQNCFIKIRPEEREGKFQIKAEVKERGQGARFRLVAVWEIPPVDKDMWDRSTFNYKRFGGRRGVE